jgi:hypothetical protein
LVVTLVLVIDEMSEGVGANRSADARTGRGRRSI